MRFPLPHDRIRPEAVAAFPCAGCAWPGADGVCAIDRACWLTHQEVKLAARAQELRETLAARPAAVATAGRLTSEQLLLLPACRLCAAPAEPRTVPGQGGKGNRYSNLCAQHLEQEVEDWRAAMRRARERKRQPA